MLEFNFPKPNKKEIIFDASKVILSKTDHKGVIQYVNEYFMSTSGYQEYELMGKPHNIIRHPDMPKAVFKFMWDRLLKGENVYAILKNLAKDGRFYWVMTSFETTYNEDGSILAHYARRKAVPKEARKVFEDLYKKIIKIERQNPEVALKYLSGYIENSGETYKNFFLGLVGMTESQYLDYFKEKPANAILPVTVLDKTINKVKQPIQPIKVVKTTITNSSIREENINKLKKDIEKLQKELDVKIEETKTKKRGFFGKLFS